LNDTIDPALTTGSPVDQQRSRARVGAMQDDQFVTIKRNK
jgi:hypothetical protein